MAHVIIVPSLAQEIDKRFRGEAIEVLEHLHSLRDQPKKGERLGMVNGIAIKELRYRGWRFYFVTDGHAITFYDGPALANVLLYIVRMSDKKHQQETITEIKRILTVIGPSGFT